MINPATIDYGKVSDLIQDKIPPNLSLRDRLAWERRLQDETIAEMERQGRLREIMLDSTSGSSPSVVMHSPYEYDKSIFHQEKMQPPSEPKYEDDSEDDDDFGFSDIDNRFVVKPEPVSVQTSDESFEDSRKQSVSQKPKLSEPKKSKTENKNKSYSNELTTIHKVPRTLIKAMRSAIPQAVNHTECLEAIVYIFTHGGCDISESAMKVVKQYEESNKLQGIDNSIMQLTDHILNLERIIRMQADMLQSIELGVCYNTFDRRYGSKEPRKSPRQTEFREQGSLDMLYRLREQAADQREDDRIERGRQIYDSKKRSLD